MDGKVRGTKRKCNTPPTTVASTSAKIPRSHQDSPTPLFIVTIREILPIVVERLIDVSGDLKTAKSIISNWLRSHVTKWCRTTFMPLNSITSENCQYKSDMRSYGIYAYGGRLYDGLSVFPPCRPFCSDHGRSCPSCTQIQNWPVGLLQLLRHKWIRVHLPRWLSNRGPFRQLPPGIHSMIATFCNFAFVQHTIECVAPEWVLLTSPQFWGPMIREIDRHMTQHGFPSTRFPPTHFPRTSWTIQACNPLTRQRHGLESSYHTILLKGPICAVADEQTTLYDQIEMDRLIMAHAFDHKDVDIIVVGRTLEKLHTRFWSKLGEVIDKEVPTEDIHDFVMITPTMIRQAFPETDLPPRRDIHWEVVERLLTWHTRPFSFDCRPLIQSWINRVDIYTC